MELEFVLHAAVETDFMSGNSEELGKTPIGQDGNASQIIRRMAVDQLEIIVLIIKLSRDEKVEGQVCNNRQAIGLPKQTVR